ncbi:hypothetical protein [Ferruginibacter sp.]|uniref:hypothetical protein n=2 Tax=Ferruginibacter sp. TaxID=1940288 RepID=UPI002658E88F|nr:hypothetical protein [Ferruginibacter sp.]
MTKLKNIAVAFATIVIFANITNAQTPKASYTVNAHEPLKVKYLGDEDKYLLFEVTLQSENFAKPLFIISDKNEGEFYSASLSTGVAPRTFKIEKRGEDQVLNFKVVLGKTQYVKTFVINTSTVEKTVVAEHDITKL